MRLNPCSCGGWSQRHSVGMGMMISTEVLILVLVEDGLREGQTDLFGSKASVLILVLVEDGLRADGVRMKTNKNCNVLILVLVEDGLRGILR